MMVVIVSFFISVAYPGIGKAASAVMQIFMNSFGSKEKNHYFRK